MAVSGPTRYEVLRRDGYACRYCGAEAPEVELTIDRVVPGGSDAPENLVAACLQCCTGKASVNPDAPLAPDVHADAIRWARARAIVLARWRAARSASNDKMQSFSNAWEGWTYGGDDNPQVFPRDDQWRKSVERWLDEGLAIDDLVELIPNAMHNRPGRDGGPIRPADRWRYYFGVVWRTIEGIERDTRVAAEAVGQPSDDRRTSDDQSTEDDLTQAYTRGYEQGHLDAELATVDGVTSAYATPNEWTNEAEGPTGQQPKKCQECGVNDEYETTGRCLPCWRDT